MAALIEKFDPAETKGKPVDAEELKRRMADHLDMLKRPNDLLRITQVSPHHFRVNTLSPRSGMDSVMPVYQISKSQFLHAEVKHGELVITDQTRR